MGRTSLTTAVMALALFSLSSLHSVIGQSELVSQEARERAWYQELQQATYVEFPNGKLYKHGYVTGKLFGTLLGAHLDTLVLWHCGSWVAFDTRSEKHVFMQARPVDFLNEGGRAGAYHAQCMTNQFPHHPWKQMAAR